MDTSRIINIVSQGKYTESATVEKVQIDEARTPYPRDRKGRITVNRENTDGQRMGLMETPGELSTANFPDALRMGITFDAFVGYRETPVTYPAWARVVDSNKQQEEYLKDSPIGILPVVAEGESYKAVVTNFDSGLIIRNNKYGMVINVTEEMRRFDQIGKVRELAELLGRSARRTEEQRAMDAITDSTLYTLNSTTGDNDEGANTASTTFSPEGLILAFNTLRTMKDRKTGMYLGVLPDTLIVTPKLWWAAQQLIMSPTLWGQGDADATVVYGQGTNNSFFNVVRQIIVSPEFGSSFGWCLMEAKRAVTFQRVDPVQILVGSSDQTSAAYMDHDGIPYRVRNWFGVGLRDQRYAFLSTSSTKPTIN
jgi:hypothetical protein